MGRDIVTFAAPWALCREMEANEAGGAACRLSPKGALAQYAATGCLNTTYYATAGESWIDGCGEDDANGTLALAEGAGEDGGEESDPAGRVRHEEIRAPGA